MLHGGQVSVDVPFVRGSATSAPSLPAGGLPARSDCSRCRNGPESQRAGTWVVWLSNRPPSASAGGRLLGCSGRLAHSRHAIVLAFDSSSTTRSRSLPSGRKRTVVKDAPMSSIRCAQRAFTPGAPVSNHASCGCRLPRRRVPSGGRETRRGTGQGIARPLPAPPADAP